jgi:release factor glutamine methyltransferase
VAAALLAAPRPSGTPPLLVWDVGTGSGAIAVALAVEFRRRGYAADVRLLATDASAEALSLAVENAVAHGVADAIEFAMVDLTDVTNDAGAVRQADLLVANLPYVPSGAVPALPVAASFEPTSALDGGADGLEVIGRLLAALPAALVPNGVALLEIGSDQAAALGELLSSRLPGWTLLVHDDLSGSPRVAELRPGSVA